MAYYICCKCKFTFERAGEVDSCPGCLHPNVMEVAGEEIAELRDNQAEFITTGN
jgi:hypothetical protein